MIFYDEYADVPREVVDAFVAECELGRLVTAGAEGVPHVGLYPFVYEPPAIALHANRSDELLADLAANPRCLFEVDDVLGVIPSYWIHPEDAVMATAYHRTVIFECTASVSADPDALAAQQMRLLARYQPEGGFRPVTPEHAHYRGAIAAIRAIRLEIRNTRVKFKLGQNRAPEVRRKVIAELRQRGRRNDARAADLLGWTIEHEASKLPAGSCAPPSRRDR
jgi:predicted FMN-binding regulatory protein PaiB